MRDLDRIQREEAREAARLRARVKNIPGDMRNIKCPCGSLRKAKNCQCETFKDDAHK